MGEGGRMSYNPFDKPIGNLKHSDLNNLIADEVAEGYWVEYKSDFQSNSKTARSIASFANTYGGWYFVGVEADKTQNIATDICGFSLASVPDPVSKVREVVKSHIDPIPVFYSKLVKLSPDKAVLVVQIPNNQETPFITRDGRIYRRVSDSSDPVPETNRYAVDRLVDKGLEVSKRFEEFCQDERTFCEAEEGQGWLNMFLSPYPLGIIERWDVVSEEGVEELIRLSQRQLKIVGIDDAETKQKVEIGTGNYPFDSGQVSLGSVVLRQVGQNAEAFNQPTAELFGDGKAKFLIPLRYIQDIVSEIETLKSDQARDALRATLGKVDNYLLRFLDVPSLWSIVTNLLNFYQVWLGQDAEAIKIRAAITLNGVWRTVPFCDTDNWGEYVSKFGLPVLHTDVIRMPRSTWGSFLLDPREQGTLWMDAYMALSWGIGLPLKFFQDILEVLKRRSEQRSVEG